MLRAVRQVGHLVKKFHLDRHVLKGVYRLSEPFQNLLESLTVTWGDPHYTKFCDVEGAYRGPRGAPANVGFSFDAVHPAVRTNPVTGWKAIFAGGMHCSHFNDVTREENALLMGMIEQLVIRNHDLVARCRWEVSGDIGTQSSGVSATTYVFPTYRLLIVIYSAAIWDNRCVKHVPTRDHVGKRKGYRVLSAGEKPFLAPNSTSRQESKNATLEKTLPSKSPNGIFSNGVNGH